MNEGQRYLLQMLQEIDAICSNNGIDYAVTGGTLIGAVRNRGFLPWDDDADIMMTADNYERFREACKTQLPDNRALRDPATCNEYWHVIPRYVRADTTAFHTCQSLTDGDVAGDVIDIFVLDPIADGDDAYKAYLQDLYLYESVVNYSNVAATRVELDPTLCKAYIDLRNRDGRTAAAKQLEQRLISHFDTNGRYYIYRWQSVPYKLERSWFDEYVKVPFEGLQLSAPKEINAYLTNYFGENWPEIPSNITPAKHNAAASLHFSYTEALTYYRPTYDRAELHKQMDERKLTLLEHAKTDNAIKDQRVRIKAEAVKANLVDTITRHADAFDAAYREGDGKHLAALMQEYIAYQTSADMIGRFTNGGMYRWMHPLLIDIEDYLFEAALMALLATDRIRFIVRLTDLFVASGRDMTPRMNEIRSSVLELRAVMDLHQNNRYEDAEHHAEALVAAYPAVRLYREQLIIEKAARYREQPDTDIRTSLQRAINDGLTCFPDDGVLLKYEADLMSESDEQAALSLYQQAAEHTRNGIVLTEIADVTGYWPTWLRLPAWAKAAGVPQWAGPDPQPLETNGNNIAEPMIVRDERKTYLMGLLGELSAVCNANGIASIAGPELVFSWRKYHNLPSREEDYRLIVTPADFGKLSHLLSNNAPKNRHFDYVLTDTKLNTFEGRWYAEDSLQVSLKANKPQKHMHMYVTLAAAENAQRSPWSRAARIYATGSIPNDLSDTKQRLLKLYRHRRSNETAAYHAFEHACHETFTSPTLAIRTDHTVNIPSDALHSTHVEAIAGQALSIPDEDATYADCAGAVDCGPRFEEKPGTVYCYALNYDGLKQANLLGDDYYRIKRTAWNANATCRDTMKKFRHNFKQMKLAVQLKEISLDLLPRKREIIQGYNEGHLKQTKEALKPLYKATRKFKGAGSPNIDDELFEVYQQIYR
jgi:phosphorylcholine metabolism protein LicD